jgi:hypothetical protein
LERFALHFEGNESIHIGGNVPILTIQFNGIDVVENELSV